jgi:hypothetical protein
VSVQDPNVKLYLGTKIHILNQLDRIKTMLLIDMLVEITKLFFLLQPTTLGSLTKYSA